MIIRSAKTNDKENISRLIAQFRIELERFKGITSISKMDQAKEEFQEYIEAEYPVFVAEDINEEILGYLVCRIDDGVLWAESLFVSATARRKGIATKLYKEAEKVAENLITIRFIIGYTLITIK